MVNPVEMAEIMILGYKPVVLWVCVCVSLKHLKALVNAKQASSKEPIYSIRFGLLMC